MLKGMTVEYLLNRSFKVQKSHTVLFHAAAGGVGLIAGQWLKYIGAESIGTVGSDDKIDLAKKVGYTHVINYNKSNFVEEVRRITNGIGVDVAYDSVGQATYPSTLSCLKKFGLFVSFGQSSGIIKNIAMADLQKNGSLYAQRPTLFDFIPDPESLREVSDNMFKMLADGHINMHINQRHPLKDVPIAFEALMARKTTGATVFDVGRS
jgi:NADPH2:quinone reductase